MRREGKPRALKVETKDDSELLGAQVKDKRRSFALGQLGQDENGRPLAVCMR